MSSLHRIFIIKADNSLVKSVLILHTLRGEAGEAAAARPSDPSVPTQEPRPRIQMIRITAVTSSRFNLICLQIKNSLVLL